MWKEYITSILKQGEVEKFSFFEPASSKDLTKVEKKLKVIMPESLACFLRETNGFSKGEDVIVCSTENIIKETLAARDHMPWKQHPEDYKGHLFFSTARGDDGWFSITRDKDGLEKVRIWEAWNSCGVFMCESLERWLKIWLSVDMGRYYRGPQHLQEYGKTVTDEIESLLSSRLQDYQKEYCWQRQVMCSCGNDAGFRLFYYGRLLENGHVADTQEFRQREEVECPQCQRHFVLFDAHQHGYDPVICQWPKRPKEEYSRRDVSQIYQCKCGSERFSLVATASYDMDFYEMIALETQKELDECYGWFDVEGICTECKKSVGVIDYECA